MTKHNGKEGSSFSTEGGVGGLSALEVLSKLSDPKLQAKGNTVTNTPMMTIKARSYRNSTEDLCGVHVFFNGDGVAVTPAYNKQAVLQYMQLRQGYMEIVSDESEVLAQAVKELVSEGELVAIPDAPTWYKPVKYTATATDSKFEYEAQFGLVPSDEELKEMTDEVYNEGIREALGVVDGELPSEDNEVEDEPAVESPPKKKAGRPKADKDATAPWKK